MDVKAPREFSYAREPLAWGQAAAKNAEKQLCAELLPYGDGGFPRYPEPQTNSPPRQNGGTTRTIMMKAIECKRVEDRFTMIVSRMIVSRWETQAGQDKPDLRAPLPDHGNG